MHTIFLLLGLLINCIIGYIITPISPKFYVKPYNPIWHERNQKLYMGDYADGKILCYDPNENKIFEATVPGITTPWFMIPLKKSNDLFLVSNNHSNSVVQWDGKSPNGRIIRDTFTIETDPAYVTHNWDTAKASPQGNFYGGTLRTNLCGNTSEPNAAGYSYSKCHGVKTIIRDQKIFGGIEWNAKGDKFYQIDSCRMTVSEYDYDGKTGKIYLLKGRVVFYYQGNYGDPASFPIGIAIDTAEKLYIAIYLGGVVLKVDPQTSSVLQVIHIPGQVCAGITWGGRNMDILYVTTFSAARYTYTGVTINATFPQSGLIYAVTDLGATGFPARSLCI